MEVIERDLLACCCAQSEIAATLDDDGEGIAATVARTAFHGMNALHAARSLHVYRYLLEVANMDVNKPDTTPGACQDSSSSSASFCPLRQLGVLASYFSWMSHCYCESGFHCLATLGRKTPLERAIAGGDLPSVRYLIDHGADIHHEREGNITFLHSAAKKGINRGNQSSDLVQLLLFLFLFLLQKNNLSYAVLPGILCVIRNTASTQSRSVEQHYALGFIRGISYLLVGFPATSNLHSVMMSSLTLNVEKNADNTVRASLFAPWLIS